jgi:hypothetical protein
LLLRGGRLQKAREKSATWQDTKRLPETRPHPLLVKATKRTDPIQTPQEFHSWGDWNRNLPASPRAGKMDGEGRKERRLLATPTKQGREVNERHRRERT